MRVFTFLLVFLPLNLLFAQLTAVEQVEFATDKYEINAEHAQDLQQLVKQMLQSADYSITLKGHTDSDGDHAYNERLSANRSQAIKDFLIAKGLKEEQIQIANFGERSPIAENDNVIGKQKNRRVEISYSHSPITEAAQLFDYFAKKRAQHFTRTATEKQEILCQDGSVIIIPADAFTFSDGRLIGDVAYELTVDEAIKTSSMFQYRLNTAHADGSLSTGGMIKLTAKVGDEELLLREGKSINISIPTAAVDPSMQMYRGDRAENETMDWQTIESPISILDAPPIDHEGVPFPEEILNLVQDLNMEIPEYPGKIRDVKFPALLEKPLPLTPNMQKPFKPGAPVRQIAEAPKNIFARINYDLEKEQALLDERYAEREARYAERMKLYVENLQSYTENQKIYNAELAAIDEQFKIDQKINFAERKVAIDLYLDECLDYEAAKLTEQKINDFKTNLGAATIEEKLNPKDNILRTDFEFKISLKDLHYFARGESLPYDESADYFEYYREAMKRAGELQQKIGYSRQMSQVRKLYKQYMYDNAAQIKESNQAVFASLESNIQYYNFDITEPEMFWCNIDTPTPMGIEFVQFENSNFSELFTFQPVNKVVNYFPTSLKKQALYPTNQPVNYLAFKFGQQGMEMSHGEFKASQLEKIELKYKVATLPEIEQAMARLDG